MAEAPEVDLFGSPTRTVAEPCFGWGGRSLTLLGIAPAIEMSGATETDTGERPQMIGQADR